MTWKLIRFKWEIDKKMSVADNDLLVTDLQILESRVLLRPDETARILRGSRSKVYLMLDSGDLEGVKLGTAMRVKTSSIKRLLGNELNDLRGQ